jgi:hypothetical protein
MSAATIRAYIADVNWTRILVLVGVVAVFTMMTVEPAFAFAALASDIVGKAGEVARAFRVILFAAAVISVLAGAAPMLWGEVRVKWMVSALAACAVIAMMGSLVNAFTGAGSATDVLPDQ